jgi:polar amino acid transport system substrate-binding protein
MDATRYLLGAVKTALLALAAWTGIAAAQDETPLDDYRARTEQARPTQGNALDDILTAGVVRIAVPQDFPPFGSMSAEKKLEGYDVDVATLIAKDLGVRLQLVPVRSADRLSLLLAKRVDLVVASLGISPERARAIAFSSPYAPFFSGVYGGAGAAVKSVADLVGRKVAVTRNTLEDIELSANAPKGVEIMRFPDNEATLQAFLSGEVDFIATGSVVAATMAKNNPARKIEVQFTIRQSPASIGVRRGEPQLLHWVNVFVLHNKLNGDLDKLSRKWFGEPLPPLPAL